VATGDDIWVFEVLVVTVLGRTVLYECCPGYMKMEGMHGCPAGTTSPTPPLVDQLLGGTIV